MQRLDRSVAMIGAATLAALIGASAWLVFPRGDDAFADCRKGVIAGGVGALGGPFTLVDETGATVTDAQVIDRPTLLYFGYTFCPDACPTDVARNADAAAILADKGIDVRAVMISVDPGRDTPERLTEWTDYFGPEVLGLTGSEDQVRAAAKAYRVLYQVPQDKAGGDYLVSHSVFTYLQLPGHGVVEFFDNSTSPDAMAERTSCFLDHA